MGEAAKAPPPRAPARLPRTMEAIDTMREVATVMPNAISANNNAIGASTIQIPRDADKPLPPLKPRNTDAI